MVDDFAIVILRAGAGSDVSRETLVGWAGFQHLGYP